MRIIISINFLIVNASKTAKKLVSLCLNSIILQLFDTFKNGEKNGSIFLKLPNFKDS